MSQRRRTLLHALGLTAAGSLAGCIGSFSSEEGDSSDDTGPLSPLQLPASTAFFEYDDLQASGNAETRKKIADAFDTDPSNVEGSVTTAQDADRTIPTVMISGSFDAGAVANSVYENVVIPQVKERDSVSEDDITEGKQNGFKLLSNDQLGRFAINGDVVMFQDGRSAEGEVTFGLDSYYEVYQGNAQGLFESSSQTGALFSTMELQATSGWFDLTSDVASAAGRIAGASVNIEKLSAVGAKQVLQSGSKSSKKLAVGFDEEPPETNIARIEDASVYSHVETTENVALFEASGASATNEDL